MHRYWIKYQWTNVQKKSKMKIMIYTAGVNFNTTKNGFFRRCCLFLLNTHMRNINLSRASEKIQTLYFLFRTDYINVKSVRCCVGRRDEWNFIALKLVYIMKEKYWKLLMMKPNFVKQFSSATLYAKKESCQCYLYCSVIAWRWMKCFFFVSLRFKN